MSMISRYRGLSISLAVPFLLSAFTQQPHCIPSAEPNTDAGCVKAITGCICTTTGSTSGGYWPDCGGCWVSVTGTESCPGGRVFHFSCYTEMACGGTAQCGTTCYCTQQPYYPFKMSCSACE